MKKSIVNVIDEKIIEEAFVNSDIKPDIRYGEIKFYSLKDSITTWFTLKIIIDNRKNEETLIEECKQFIKMIKTDTRLGINRVKEILGA